MEWVFPFLSDAIAIILFYRRFAIIGSAEDHGMISSFVDECIGRLSKRTVETATRDGLVRLGIDRFGLADLRSTVRNTSLIALAGALGMAADARFQVAALMVAAAWIVIAAMTWKEFDVIRAGAKACQREKLVYGVLFSVYIALSVIIKAVTLILASQ
ncbi:MAG: hypothetical protein ACYSWU_12855 [Planctomycetota bacterium]|jgi:hypothetical protein